LKFLKQLRAIRRQSIILDLTLISSIGLMITLIGKSTYTAPRHYFLLAVISTAIFFSWWLYLVIHSRN